MRVSDDALDELLDHTSARDLDSVDAFMLGLDLRDTRTVIAAKDGRLAEYALLVSKLRDKLEAIKGEPIRKGFTCLYCGDGDSVDDCNKDCPRWIAREALALDIPIAATEVIRISKKAALLDWLLEDAEKLPPRRLDTLRADWDAETSFLDFCQAAKEAKETSDESFDIDDRI